MTRKVTAFPTLVNVAEAAERLRVSQTTVRLMIKTGKLPALKIGGVVRIREEVLLQVLDGRIKT